MTNKKTKKIDKSHIKKRNKNWQIYKDYYLKKTKSKKFNDNFLTNDLYDFEPKVSKSKNKTKHSFKDIKVGSVEYSEGPVGCTYIHFDKGARVYQSTQGGYVANMTMSSLNNDFNLEGIAIAGSSTMGLEAITGCSAELMVEKEYFNIGNVNGAIISSGAFMKPGNMVYADKKLGRFAVRNRIPRHIFNGQVGAGCSATHGQGSAFKNLKNGIKIMCIVVNNALGDVYKNGKIVHKLYSKPNIKPQYNLDFKSPNNSKNKSSKKTKKPSNKSKKTKKQKYNTKRENTTIMVLITNLDLDISYLQQMAQQVNASFGKSIRPFNTLVDGDVLYACSTREKKMDFTSKQFVALCDKMSDVVEEAIHNSIK